MTKTLNTSIFSLCIMPLSLLHERRINVKKSNQGDGVPAANTVHPRLSGHVGQPFSKILIG